MIQFCVLLLATAAIDPVTVFVGGSEGYHTYRIPALAVAADGALLAFAEGRRDNGGDPGQGDIDLVLKRSTDGGETWSDLIVLDDPGEGWSASNPTPVMDHASGRILLLFNRWEPGRSIDNCEPGTRQNQCWIISSDDNGETWTDKRDITSATRNIDKWPYTYFGPGGAIQMASGRLVVPAATRVPDGDKHRDASYVVYSDDGGATWRAGAPMWHVSSNENQVVELYPGYLLMNARQVSGDQSFYYTSSDNGLTWGLWVPGATVTPVATGWEILEVDEPGGRALIWSGPRGPGRNGMTLHADWDMDQYFERTFPLSDNPAAYSDLVVLPNGHLGIIWETGDDNAYERIDFTSVTPAQLSE
jgi:sialidase-1